MGIADEKLVEVHGFIDMTESQRTSFLPVIQEEMEVRVGQAISAGMSKGQMAEFESLIDGDAEKNLQWLESNVPDYKKKTRRLACCGRKAAEVQSLSVISQFNMAETRQSRLSADC